MSVEPIAISLNFDSLNEAYGFPAGYRDPSFFSAFDRLSDLCAEFGFPLSIYIIGRDLENNDHASQVRHWASCGHEIGNHSWSHHFNIGSLPPAEVRDEIKRSHDRIAQTIGREPKGFIAPAWATSPTVINTLIDLRYEYDTSDFPSPLLYPMTAKIALNHAGNWRKGLRMLNRKDWMTPLQNRRTPYIAGRDRQPPQHPDETILIMPLPSAGRFSPCIWHTFGFVFGLKALNSHLSGLLATHPGFYYLIHPGDFIDSAELHPEYVHHLARMDRPLDEKMARLREAFGLMKQSGRPLVTMLEAARHHRSSLDRESPRIRNEQRQRLQ
jgi:peptidoglycan/xylan/chitin deacetylase (PgdA/CDA1 family)